MEKEKETNETKKVNIGNYRKIDDILDNDRLIKIYALLPDKETKIEFLDTILSTYEDRLAEKFAERLEDEFEANDRQIKQGQLKENIKNKRSIIDILRSRRREPFRQGITERINNLMEQLRVGNYISKEDREFLVKHLSGRPVLEWESPSQKREEIRDIIDTYIEAKNTELSNDAKRFANKQKLEEQILEKKSILAGALGKWSRNWSEAEINRLKSEIAQLEEFQRDEATNNSKLDSMLHTTNSHFNIEKNNIDLEKLMTILDRESTQLMGQGVKLPETGVREDDVVEIPADQAEKAKGDFQAEESKNQERPIYVVNSQASLEQKYDKDGIGDVTIIEPTLGSSIEDFSTAIMDLKQNSQHIVTKFNNFEIDSNDYQNSEEIVEAYEKHRQEHSKGTKELSSKQEEITPAEIETVVAIDPRALQIMSEISATKQLVKTAESQKDVEVEKE